MKHSSLATIVPKLELFDLPKRGRREDVLPTNHIGCHVTGWGEPATVDGEPFLGRWGCGGLLVVTVDDEGNGPRALKGETFGLRKAAEGTLSIGVTASRLVGTFRQASSMVGGIDERKNHQVFVLSWPFEELATVELTWKNKMLGGRKVSEMVFSCVDVPAQLRLIAAYPLNEKWDGSMTGSKDDMPGLAAQVVKAAGAFRLAQQPEAAEAARLQRVLGGERDVDGADEIAWLTDPEA